MPDVQHALLSKVILDVDIRTAVNARITPEFFSDPTYRRIYEYLLDHWRKHGTAPDEAVANAAYPDQTWVSDPQPISYFIERLRQRRKRSLLLDSLAQTTQYVQSTDPDAMDMLELVLREALMKVRLETTAVMDSEMEAMHTDFVPILDERILNPGHLRGISSSFKGIDYVTGGFQPEQLVTLIGLPKAMKSSLLLYMAMQCIEVAKSPLFIGFEMSTLEQQERIASLAGHVGLTKIMNGTVNQIEYRRIDKALKLFETKRNMIISTDISNGMTVSSVQAKIMEYNPDIVFVDGAYLMQSELPKVEPGSAQALTDIARELKKLAQSQRIPIVVTTQASQTRSRGGKLNAESAMYTQAWRQSSDVMLGVERVDPEDGKDDGEVSIKLKVLSSRSGPRTETEIIWDWSKGVVVEVPAYVSQPASALDDED